MKKHSILKTAFVSVLFLGLLACEKQVDTAPAIANCNLTTNNHPNAAKYQRIADKFLAAGAVGVSINIKSPEGTWSVAKGKADLATDADLTPCHSLRMGSISKIFASVMILKLQEQGKLNINDKAADYLPAEYVKNIANLDKATIRDLLQHTSGVPEYLGINQMLKIGNLSVVKRSAAESIKTVYGKKAQFEVGKSWSYANSNYLLIALIIENVTKKPAYEAITEQIIKPLNLTNTYASTTLPANMSRGFYDSFNNGIMRDNTLIDNNAVGGQDMLDGGLISNPSDLSTFIEALKTGKVISAQSLAEMEAPANVPVPDLPEEFSYIKNYGLGLFLLEFDGEKAIGHAGNVQSFNCLSYYFPEKKLAISIMLNSYSKKLQTALFNKETVKLAL